MFAGTEATRTHSVFPGSVASLIVELKRYVLSLLNSPCFGQRNQRLVVIANSNMLCSERVISFTLIANSLHCPSRKDRMIPTYLPVWRHDHEHRGGAVQPGHPDTAGHEVQPDLHNARPRLCRGHQRIPWHRVSHHLQQQLQKLTFSTFDPGLLLPAPPL